MNNYFRTIGIIGYPRNINSLSTHKMLFSWLSKQGYNVIVENKISQYFLLKKKNIGNLVDIGKNADLAIIVGGDGNMLYAARTLAKYDIKVIGINRGNLGFLTDLDPNSALKELSKILSGNFFIEKRFLLEVKIMQRKIFNTSNTAINEVVLHSSRIANMIEFEVYIDSIFSFSHRSDGLIISTPTGSTAYSLSAGGPIISPSLEAIALIPMFPHTLSSRPLVINGNSIIKLKFSKKVKNLKISCDNQIIIPIKYDEEILIQKSKNYLQLIHPNCYNYFNMLNNKLGWLKKLF